MPFFSYRARNAQGQTQTGQAESESASRLAEQLRADGLMVLSVTPAKAQSVRQDGLPPWWDPAWLLPVTSLDVELGFRQMASMLRSGVSVLTALKTTSMQSSRPRAASLWLNLEDHIRRGGTLSDAMRLNKRCFTDYIIQLVRVGEHSGEMDTSLSRAAEHLELHRNVRMMVVNALIYPCIATVMAVGVSAYLVFAVIPKISVFLEASGARLPGVTQALIDVSHWLRLNGPLAAAIVIGVIAAWFAIRRHSVGREMQDSILLRLPVAGRILRLSATAVFARGLGLLIDSGVTLLDALSALEQLLSNRRLSRRIARAREGVMRGETLATMLEQAPEFLPHLARMTAVAEATGTLGPTLEEVARFHESLLVIAIKRFSVLIEPLMIIVTGGIVGFVYIAFFMALFSMVSTI